MQNYPVNVPKPQTSLPFILVTAAVVVVIAAILGPVFASARSNAREVVCVANVKQQAQALLFYTQDWDQTLPTAANWMDEIAPYMKKAEDYTSGTGERAAPFTCPVVDADKDYALKLVYGYAYNSLLSKLRVEVIAAPSDAVMIFESSYVGKNAADPLSSIMRPGRHHGGDNVTYVDGHVKRIWDNQLETLKTRMEQNEPWFKLAGTQPSDISKTVNTAGRTTP